MINKSLCPESVLKIQLPAEDIPNDAKVCKRTGENTYILKHQLTLYKSKQLEGDLTPVVIVGFFLVGSRGGITQIHSTEVLCWIVRAEDFIDTINVSWEKLGRK
jgi:hypothetical protein